MHLDINLKFALTLALVLIVIGVAAMAHGQDGATTTAPAPASVTQTSTGANSPNINGVHGNLDIKPEKESPKNTPKYSATEDQNKDLRIDQLAAQLAQSQLAAKEQTMPEFNQFQQALNALRQQCARVIAANHWPATVQCDIQQAPVRFCDKLPCVDANAPAAAPATAPANKK